VQLSGDAESIVSPDGNQHIDAEVLDIGLKVVLEVLFFRYKD